MKTPSTEVLADLDDMPPKVLRKMIRQLMGQRLSDRDPEDLKKQDEKNETERKKLPNLHEEQRGAAPKTPVEKDDLPEGLDDIDEPSELEEAAGEEHEGHEEEDCEDCSGTGKKKKYGKKKA
jgi:hypothetical protein